MLFSIIVIRVPNTCSHLISFIHHHFVCLFAYLFFHCSNFPIVSKYNNCFHWLTELICVCLCFRVRVYLIKMPKFVSISATFSNIRQQKSSNKLLYSSIPFAIFNLFPLCVQERYLLLSARYETKTETCLSWPFFETIYFFDWMMKLWDMWAQHHKQQNNNFLLTSITSVARWRITNENWQ